MALTRVVILKRGTLHRDGFMPFGAHPAVPSPLGVVIAEISTADIQDLPRDPSVQDWAEDLPLRLIGAVPTGMPSATSSNESATPSHDGKGGGPIPTWGLEAIGAARDSARSGRGVRIAVLDTGIDRQHPAFAGINLELGRNVRNFTKEPDADSNGHGTHCAATIFGRDVDGYRIGVARGVTDVLIGKVLSESGGGFAEIADGLAWAFAERAHIVSMSLGIDFYKHLVRLRDRLPEAEAMSQALTDYGACVRVFDRLCEQLADINGIYRGMLIVAAAGNESNRPEYAVSVAPPANAFGVVSVGAIDRATGDPAGSPVARFSNSLPTLCAPGVDVVSAQLHGGLKSASGTSMAAPHVAGVAALYAEQQVAAAPTKFRPQVVLEAMLKGAKKLPTLAPEDVGAGLVQAPL